ncbi:MAG: nucleotidyl transferase AbiEii/AbiGii toxin family protein [Acidimicrobiales bacterium]
MPPVVAISLPGIEQPGYRAYPLVDHVADKVAAILETYGHGRPSTRFRDLVDLTALVLAIRVRATDQRPALVSELERRDLQIPQRFAVPDRELWEEGFARAARRAVGSPAHTLAEALAIVEPFIDPLLVETANGVWDPRTRGWIATL